MKKHIVVVTILIFTIGLFLSVTNFANATPILPSFSSATYPVMGESLLENDYDLTVDWIVYEPGNWDTNFSPDHTEGTYDSDNEWLYLYQVENESLPAGSSLLTQLDLFSVAVEDCLNVVTAAGWQDTDLDTTFGHNITGETENTATLEYNVNNVSYVNNVSWTFGLSANDALDIDAESAVLWFSAKKPPIYDQGHVDDGFHNRPIGRVPSPAVPEPATLLLLGFGLGFIGLGKISKEKG